LPNMDQGLDLSLSYDSYALQQSMMTVSDIDWKDSYDIIDEDERKMNEATTPPFFGKSHEVLCERSWGVYFAQRSGTMGNIAGTKHRPYFSSPDTNGGGTQISCKSRDRANRSPKKYEPDLLSGQVLSVEELVAIMSNHQSEENSKEEPKPASPLCFGSNWNDISCIEEIHEDDGDDSPQYDNHELQRSIESAIQRRKSLGLHTKFQQNVNLANDASADAMVAHQLQANDDDMVISHQTTGIEQHHKFVQFFVDINRFEMPNVEKECGALLRHYVSVLADCTAYIITHFDAQFNHNTKQCTFYLLATIEETVDLDPAQTQNWCQLFMDVVHSHAWDGSIEGRATFSELVPHSETNSNLP